MNSLKKIGKLGCFIGFYIITQQSYAQKSITIKIDPKKTYQTIDNIGASSAWNTEFVGKYWDTKEREQMAKWLFSKAVDETGSPLGIGLSSYRFNIGGGTTELGDSSRLKDEKRRVEGFLNSDGQYDWSKQSGYLWFVKKAKEYGTERLIAFSNTPPVQMTSNGLGFKTVLDYTSNLKPDKYPDFAHFLTTVLKHFDQEGLHFDYISPVNEPQWKWYNNDQEGSPWTNVEIAHIVRDLDSAMTEDNISSKIILPEAGNLEYLYSHEGKAGRQIQVLYGKESSYRVNSLRNVLNVACGHSYYTDSGALNRMDVRKKIRDTAAFYETHFWQSEYSMLGDGYKEGKTGELPALDCALFLAKIIHDDFVYANAEAWQFWNSVEPGSPDVDTRYYLMALQPSNESFRSGKVIQTKMLWALGNYSRFVRPGMTRIDATAEGEDENFMVSSYQNEKQRVVVIVNSKSNEANVNILNETNKKSFKMYVTDQNNNLRNVVLGKIGKKVKISPKSITTLVYNL